VPYKKEFLKLSKSELITTIAGLPDSDPRVARVVEILSGKTPADRPSSMRLLRICDCVRESSMSCTTWYRLIKESQVRTVKVRDGGATRISEVKLRRIVEGRCA
jgi:hypothetical protein